MAVAVIGSGLAGLAAAYRLQSEAAVTLFEAGDHFGGDANSVEVTLPNSQGQPVTYPVDTGFLVFNEATHPSLVSLFDELGVNTVRAELSFSVQVHGDEANGDTMTPAELEWSASSLRTVFAQRRNLLRPRFWIMLKEVVRFNRLCAQIANQGDGRQLQQTLGDFLQQHRFGPEFREWYFLPMLGSIGSCPSAQMLRFPVATVIRFCHNHGLIRLSGRPPWWTVAGGAQQYVQKIISRLSDVRLRTPVHRVERGTEGVWLHTSGGVEHFDAVIMAVQSDQALDLLANPSAREREVLGAIAYQPNRAVLHTDTTVMPRHRAAWAARNYERAPKREQEGGGVCVHYCLNALQPLPFADSVLLSFNPVRPIAAEKVLAEFDYAHPVFDATAIAAQSKVSQLQGWCNTWFCGAWTRYGFHEDGLQSGYAAADAVRSGLRRDIGR